jgi:ATP-dependent DNA helicase RecQ
MLGERDLMRITNLKQTQIRVIKADLLEQGIIRQLTNRKFEYIVNAPALNTKLFQDLRDAKMLDLEEMITYVETNESRMKFLCKYLGDSTARVYSGCDNTGEKKIHVIVTPEWESKLQAFRENYFPVLEFEAKGSSMVNGIAASYYGLSNVGSAIHNSKYENAGDFPDFLVRMTTKAFYKAVGKEQYDIILFVPPTVSGDLVKNFAQELSQSLKIELSSKLIKIKSTKEQKVFGNSILKSDNVRDAFAYSSPDEIENKKIIVIDDIFDSGATMKEIGRYLTEMGALKIFPLVIARTVGGDLI